MATSGDEQRDGSDGRDKEMKNGNGPLQLDLPLHELVNMLARKFMIFTNIYKHISPVRQLQHVMRILEEYGETRRAYEEAFANGYTLSLEDVAAMTNMININKQVRPVIAQVLGDAREYLHEFEVMNPMLRSLMRAAKKRRRTD